MSQTCAAISARLTAQCMPLLLNDSYMSKCKVAFAQALLRLEGLVLGGAASFQGFLELIRPLLEPIITQLLDRCGPSYSLALLEPPLKGAASLMHNFSRRLS